MEEKVLEGEKINEQEIEYRAEKFIRLLLAPTVIAGIFEVSAFYNPNRTLLMVLTNVILISLVIWHALHERVSWKTAVVLGAVAGGLANLIVSIYKFIVFFHVLTFFNLFTSPFIVAIFDGILAGILFSLTRTMQIKFFSRSPRDLGIRKEVK